MSKPGKVIPLPDTRSVTIDIKHETVTLATLRVGNRRLSRQLFEQIPAVRLEEWPASYDILGWVRHGEPWLLWTEGRRLVRSNVAGWSFRNRDGTRSPVTDEITQIYL